VKASPNIRTKLPVSRLKEKRLATHYGWWLVRPEAEGESAATPAAAASMDNYRPDGPCSFVQQKIVNLPGPSIRYKG
jgi:hypothetical protein